MCPRPRIHEAELLERALEALKRTTGLTARIVGTDPESTTPCGDATVEFETAHPTPPFLAEVRDVRHFAALALASERLACRPEGSLPLLVAPYMTRALAERCRALRLPFIDAAGNAHLAAPGLTVYVTGEPRPADLREETRYRAFTVAGMKIVFVLLARPELAAATYRDLSRASGVALGAVGPVVQDLENRGLLLRRATRGLSNTRALAEAWVARFPDTLRPRLLQRRYMADPERLLALDLKAHHAYWGGEVAGQRLTGYLKPERFTVYLGNSERQILVQGRMRLDPNGNIELLKAFWNLPADEERPDVVPPLLAYADLMATGDGRNLETARLIHERYLGPIFGR